MSFTKAAIGIIKEYGGGVVFELRGDGHGLIVSMDYLVENGRGLSWGSSERLSKKYNGGGYEDWYVPSIEELDVLYGNLDRVNEMLVELGAEQIKKDWHWSSTQGEWGKAWCRNLDSGKKIESVKDGTPHARVIRAF